MGVDDKRFVFVVGKGGVGKTTVSAALALRAAQAGKRVLVAQCNAKDRMGQALGVAPIGPQLRNILPNLDAVNMAPDAALEEYGMMVLKVRALYKVIFENRFVSAFLRGTPGLDAWAMLGKAQHHALEQIDGQARYDLVIVDAPATGHGLDLLRVPKVIIDVAPPGLLRREAERAWSLFSDPQRAGVVLVSLPEDMPTNETLELHNALHNELRLPIAALVVNGLLDPIFDAQDHNELTRLLQQAAPRSPLHTYLRTGQVRSQLEGIQRGCVQRLQAHIQAPLTELPQLSTRNLGPDQLQTLAACFATPENTNGVS